MYPIILCILDGWGISPPGDDNAIHLAQPKQYQRFLAEYPHSALNASELFVGLPSGQMGNSEVGHSCIGAGRVIMQELPRISLALKDGSLVKTEGFKGFIAKIANGGTIHLMGLLSDGGVHAHIDHIIRLSNLLVAMGYRVLVHAFSDGRDTPPQSVAEFFDQFHQQAPRARIATVCGRYYAMDRDKNWHRVSLAFNAIVHGRGARADDTQQLIAQNYPHTQDEFFLPTIIGDYAGMGAPDGMIFCNFRADRARELCQALAMPEFHEFDRGNFHPHHAKLAMVEYSESLSAHFIPIFQKQNVRDSLGEVIAQQGLRQLRLAETEKYAHVTFFMNGGVESLFPLEQRIMIPSPKVATYDLQPEMSAAGVTQALLAQLDQKNCDFVIMNYANADMVGHTGNLDAAIKAVLAIDDALSQIHEFLANQGGVLFLTADHGNIEDMHDEHNHQPNTAHSLNLVPFVVVSPWLKQQGLLNFRLKDGGLADIAPTILDMMGIAIPSAMDGQSLIVRESQS